MANNQGTSVWSLAFVSYRATVRPHRRRSDRRQGLATLFSVECESDERLKLGIWFGPDPAAGQAEAEAEAAAATDAATPVPALAGTVADPAAVEAFVSNFRLCAQ